MYIVIAKTNAPRSRVARQEDVDYNYFFMPTESQNETFTTEEQAIEAAGKVTGANNALLFVAKLEKVITFQPKVEEVTLATLSA